MKVMKVREDLATCERRTSKRARFDNHCRTATAITVTMMNARQSNEREVEDTAAN